MASTPKKGASLPPAIEMDPLILPSRVSADDVEQRPPEGFYRYEPEARPTATAITYADCQSCSDLQAARLDRVRAKELAYNVRCDVISDVVPPSGAGDGLDTACMGNSMDESDMRGGVWSYLFPGELQVDSMAIRGGIIKKGSGTKEGEQRRGLRAYGSDEVLELCSGTGHDEPHSWGGVLLRLFRDSVPPSSP